MEQQTSLSHFTASQLKKILANPALEEPETLKDDFWKMLLYAVGNKDLYSHAEKATMVASCKVAIDFISLLEQLKNEKQFV